MTRFYLIRHGEKIKQVGDPPLSEKGKLQAAITAKYFQTLSVGKIISSPLLRTKQTAQQIADILNMEVLLDDLLKERVNWGDDPQQTLEDFLAMWQKATKDRGWIPQVGDSSRSAGQRLDKLIRSQKADYQSVAMITHGGIITDFLRNIFNGQQLEEKCPGFTELIDEKILECSITVVDFDAKKDNYNLIEVASVKHLQGI